MKALDQKIKEIIKSSLRKRIAGHGPIDNITSNENLIEHWLTAIVVLSSNCGDIEISATYINAIQSLFGPMSLEDTRAFLYLVSQRFIEEIAAYNVYLNQKDEEPEIIVLHEVMKELEYIEDGDFMFS